jgi:hypothetical protein
LVLTVLRVFRRNNCRGFFVHGFCSPGCKFDDFTVVRSRMRMVQNVTGRGPSSESVDIRVVRVNISDFLMRFGLEVYSTETESKKTESNGDKPRDGPTRENPLHSLQSSGNTTRHCHGNGVIRRVRKRSAKCLLSKKKYDGQQTVSLGNVDNEPHPAIVLGSFLRWDLVQVLAVWFQAQSS